MKLVLAAKPSVAQNIAKVLGAAKREDGYLEGNEYVVSWCVGYLVEQAQSEACDAKYSKWAYADLPIFRFDWQYMHPKNENPLWKSRCRPEKRLYRAAILINLKSLKNGGNISGNLKL